MRAGAAYAENQQPIELSAIAQDLAAHIRQRSMNIALAHEYSLGPAFKRLITQLFCFFDRIEERELVSFQPVAKRRGERVIECIVFFGPCIAGNLHLEPMVAIRARSEERRVGKECRSRWTW